MPLLPSKRSSIEPFHAMDVLAEANRLRDEGKPVISMAVGQPGDPAPPQVLEAARAALEIGRIGYTDALGLPALRRAIADYYREHYGVITDQCRIVVTTGSSAAFNLAFLAMFDVGERVAITAPGYPAYRNILNALGLEVVEIPLGDQAYLTGEELRRAHNTAPLAGVLFASPANPTGAVTPPEALSDLLETASGLGIKAISDEIYHRLNYSGPDMTALSYADDAVIINSFSKYYCMTGWRIGWMVVPDSLLRPIECLQQSLYISAPELSQRAAVAAFAATDHLERVKQRYAENRAMLFEALPKMRFRLAAPMDGAFYAYCDVSSFTNDSMEFARKMLSEIHVAATPGLDFDPVQGNRYMRFSYAGKPDDMREALGRLSGWLR